MTALSTELWGIDWTRHVPFSIGSVVVQASTFERAAPFVSEHYGGIFQEDAQRSRFTNRSPNARKARYYELFGDFFEFRADGRTVGLLAGTPHDWATYYVRSAGMLDAYQGYGVIQSFLMRVVFEALRTAGVERVELDVSPSNLPMMHIATRMRFHPTGTLLSERWGAQIHFTKFLDPGAEEAFVDGFCTGRRYQKGEPDEKALRTAHVLNDESGSSQREGGQREKTLRTALALDEENGSNQPEGEHREETLRTTHSLNEENGSNPTKGEHP